MEEKTRQSNWRLLVGHHKGQANLASAIGTITQSKVSRYCDGKDSSMFLENRYEKALELPSGWFARDNESLLLSSEKDFELLTEIRKLDDETKARLLAFATATQNEVESDER